MLSDGIRHVPKSTTPPELRSGLPVVLITGDDTGEKDPPPAADDDTVCCTGSDVISFRNLQRALQFGVFNFFIVFSFFYIVVMDSICGGC